MLVTAVAAMPAKMKDELEHRVYVEGQRGTQATAQIAPPCVQNYVERKQWKLEKPDP